MGGGSTVGAHRGVWLVWMGGACVGGACVDVVCVGGAIFYLLNKHVVCGELIN